MLSVNIHSYRQYVHHYLILYESLTHYLTLFTFSTIDAVDFHHSP